MIGSTESAERVKLTRRAAFIYFPRYTYTVPGSRGSVVGEERRRLQPLTARTRRRGARPGQSADQYGSACRVRNRCAALRRQYDTSAMLTSLVCVERERRTSARHAAQKKSSPMPTMLMFLAPREGDRCQLLCAAVCEPHKMSSGPRGQMLLCNALDVIAGIRQRHRFSSARAAGAA